ncbi:hypothetical protein FE257_003670 [Aspergillus nanangensis]|uniref:Uncharacterized protein n=1 Tax=Aspergillus nanangensis TaxID=2582783 RepID=A0AAD4GXK2_ASPNN|nr:hypothetical protein FE257_003670 [Aspergillus nanangensis]
MPGPGDIVAASFTSPIDAIYLGFIFDPIFTASYPNSRKVEHISFLQAILRAFASPRVYPPATAHLVDLATLVQQYPDRTIATFPECTTTNARAILPLSRCLLSAPSNTKIFPVSLRYTSADIVTPLPGRYVRFLWALVSEWKHLARVRVAEPVTSGKISADGSGSSGATRRATYDTNYLDTFDAAQGGDSSSASDDGTITASETALLNHVADALARLGRVRRVGLGVREKEDFVRMWTRNKRPWLWWL